MGVLLIAKYHNWQKYTLWRCLIILFSFSILCVSAAVIEVWRYIVIKEVSVWDTHTVPYMESTVLQDRIEEAKKSQL